MTDLNGAAMDTRCLALFRELIPDLAVRRGEYIVDVSEVDQAILALFRDHLGMSVPSLRKAVTGHDEQEIRREAHSLMGMGGAMGVPSLSVVAEELSAGARQGDYARCAALVEALENWMGVWGGAGV